MRTPDKTIYYEVRLPDGRFEQVHLEQLDIGDVVRCRFPGMKEWAVYEDDKTKQPTTLLTMISQTAYRVLYGDHRDEVLAQLVSGTTHMPGAAPVGSPEDKNVKPANADAVKTRRRRTK